MKTTKQSRRKRGKPVRLPRPIVLQERDFDLLLLIGKTGYCSTEQIARALFPSIDVCRKRLRKIYDRTRYLRIILMGSTKPSVFGLTTTGLAALKRQRPEAAEHINLNPPPALDTLTHHLGIVDVRCFASALAATFKADFEWSNARGHLHTAWKFPKWRLEPDGLLSLERPGTKPLNVAVEVDTGTEPTKVLISKLERYKAPLLKGTIREIWWSVLAGKRRTETVTNLITETSFAGRSMARSSVLLSKELLTTRPISSLPERLLP